MRGLIPASTMAPSPLDQGFVLQQFVRDIQVLVGHAAGIEARDPELLLMDAVNTLPNRVSPLAYWVIRGLTVTVLKRLADGRHTDAFNWDKRLVAVLLSASTDDLRKSVRLAVEALQTSDMPAPAHDWRARSAINYMRTNCHRPGLTLDCVRRTVNLSRWHLGRLLRKETGMNYPELLRSIRIARASELLCTSPLSIKEVATAAGYVHPTELNRDFRRVYGTTPTEWRRSALSSS